MICLPFFALESAVLGSPTFKEIACRPAAFHNEQLSDAIEASTGDNAQRRSAVRRRRRWALDIYLVNSAGIIGKAPLT
jgi:hypothetical protein